MRLLEVIGGKGFSNIDWLLRWHYRRPARRRGGITRGHSAHCADVASLDRNRAWHPPIDLHQVGRHAVLCLLVAGDDSDLVLPAWLGADRLRDVLAD